MKRLINKKLIIAAALILVITTGILSACGKKPHFEANNIYVFVSEDKVVANVEIINVSDENLDTAEIINSSIASATLNGEPKEFTPVAAAEGLSEDNLERFVTGTVNPGRVTIVQLVFDIPKKYMQEVVEIAVCCLNTKNEVVRLAYASVTGDELRARITYPVLNYDVELTRMEKLIYDSKTMLCSWFTFTNRSGHDAKFTDLALKMMQGGEPLQPGYLPYGHPYYNDPSFDSVFDAVPDGESVTIATVSALNNKNEAVTVKIQDMGTYSEPVLLDETINPEEIEIEDVGISMVFSMESAKTYLLDGRGVIELNMDLANLSLEEIKFADVLEIIVQQDGKDLVPVEDGEKTEPDLETEGIGTYTSAKVSRRYYLENMESEVRVTVNDIANTPNNRLFSESYTISGLISSAADDLSDIVLYKEGDKNDQISEVQEFLVMLGYLDGKNATGTLDAATTKAIEEFQESNDLDPTGKLDFQTFNTIMGGTGVPREAK